MVAIMYVAFLLFLAVSALLLGALQKEEVVDLQSLVKPNGLARQRYDMNA